MKDKKGIALIVTLWLLVMLMVMAMNFSFSVRGGSASTRNFKEEIIAYYKALTAYEETLSYLLSDKDPQVDFIDKDGIYWSDTQRASISGKRVIDNIEVEISVNDEESRLNINTLNDDMLRRLFTYTHIPEDSLGELIESLADWKDPDDLHHLSGGETEYYKSLETPYPAKNRPLDVVEELLLIKGFKPEYLYGNEDIKPLKPMITTFGKAININTASQEVLEFIGISPLDIENIMKQRTQEVGGLRLFPSGIEGIVLTTFSSNFRIEVSAKIPNSSQVLRIISVVKRLSGPKGPELKTIYWKEEIEGSRA